MMSLAKRFRYMFPGIFKEPYSPDSYTFAYANSQRTQASCEAFIDELLGADMPLSQVKQSINDTLIRVRHSCENCQPYFLHV